MSEQNEKKSNIFAAFFTGVGKVFKTFGRWIARMFMGGSKELKNVDVFAVEKLESPSKLAVKAFFRRKLAVGALVVLIALFLLVFIGPLFVPMNVNFIDPGQANIAPTVSMRKVPSKLKNEIVSISGYADFTVGVSKDHSLFIWGNTKNSLTGVNYGDFPEEIREGNVYMAAAGSDHIVAVVINEDDATKGHLVMWGDKNRGQLGYNTGNEDDPVITLPEEILHGALDLDKIEQIVCAKQVSAMIYDGHVYYWGNTNTCLNMARAQRSAETTTKRVKEVHFTNYYTAMLCEDGTVLAPGEMSANHFRGEDAFSLYLNMDVDLVTYLSGKKITDMATTKNCFVFLMEDGDILVQGASQYGEHEIYAIPQGEKTVNVEGGSFHVAAVTDAGKVYLWGSNEKKQCDLSGSDAEQVYLGAYQTYLVNGEGKLLKSCGLKGYLFGTDNYGRDTLTRIIHGGKMTMTIGAVAVIISSFIAIIVGCVSGYFGGWVDMLLMRVTEIFAAIPFLPFAMMLSYVLTRRPLSETTRIFIIMFILGLLSWTGLAHMIRGQVLAEREKEFVLAAKAMGVKERRIAFRHILPNVISVVLVSMTLDFAGCLLTESSLSYLGFGVQQPRPTWGNMLNGANNSLVIQNYWWQWVFPAIFLGVATICINIIGDTLRDVLDPKSSQEK